MSTIQPISTHPRFNDLTGEKFGRLTVIGYIGRRKTRSMWACRCACGQAIVVESSHLSGGHSQSCGCARVETLARIARRHGGCLGGRKSTEYAIWAAMLRRCYNPKDKSFRLYGGRGITVCTHWRESFSAFLLDMGSRPSLNHSLDRFPDNNGPYAPANCRWATAKEQGRNSRWNRLLTHDGITQSLAGWAESVGLPYHTLYTRLNRGWSVADALTRPARRGRTVLAPAGAVG